MRALTTAELAADAGGWNCEVRAEPGLYGAGTTGLLLEIQALDNDLDTVMLTGHEPTLSSLAGLLIGGFMAWTSGGRVRRRARMAEREAESLQRELSALLRRAEHAERDAIATALPEPKANDHADTSDRPSASAGASAAGSPVRPPTPRCSTSASTPSSRTSTG